MDDTQQRCQSLPGQLVHLNAVRHVEREARRAEAWALRLEGCTVRQIAERLCVSIGVAATYLQETLSELRETSRESADSWRQLELDRLDAVISTWLPVSRDPRHPEAARGAVICVRAIEAQARLLGLLQSSMIMPTEGKPAEPVEAQLARSPALRAAMRRQLDEADRLAAQGVQKPTGS